MPIAGPNSLTNVVIPATWDAATLTAHSLRDGTTLASLLGNINAGLQVAQAEIANGPLAGLMYMTDQRTVEYGVGSSKTFEDHTEFAQPDSQRAETTGHMLPLSKKDHKLGWTMDFLEDVRTPRILADVAGSIQAYKDVVEKSALTRLFKLTGDSGKKNGLGASGVSVPFADGGTADSTYIPTQRMDRAGVFANSHTHFLRISGITQANVETAATHLWEHGHDAPYDLLASESDIAAWTTVANVTGYVARDRGLVSFGTNVSVANVSEQYQGVINTNRGPVRLWTSARIPTTYWSLYKSYGQNDPRNPLYMAFDPLYGMGPKLFVENVSRHPLAGAIIQVKYGIGVGEDRTAAVLVLNAGSGNYTTPAIS